MTFGLSRQTTAALLTGILSIVIATQAQAENYWYAYHDGMIPLQLDTQRIAVFNAGSSELLLEGGLVASGGLADLNIEAPDLIKAPLPTYETALVPENVQSDQGIHDLVVSIAQVDGVTFVSPVFFGHQNNRVTMTQNIIVHFSPEIDGILAETLIATFAPGTILERDFAGIHNAYYVRCDTKSGFEILDWANELAAQPETISAEPDFISDAYTNAFIPNDPFFSSLWGIRNTGQNGGTNNMDMDGDLAWDHTTGSASIVVGIMDTGITWTHTDLNAIPGSDFTGQGSPNGEPVNSCDNHGTQVAGCVSAKINNGQGVVGIAPDCRVASLRVFIANVPCDSTGSVQSSWMINALAYCAQNGIRVTNTSLGGLSPSPSLETQFQLARDFGIIHFAATGNDNQSTISYPSSIQWVNAVGAVNRNGNRAGFSNYGTGIAYTAPGQEIVTTQRGGGYTTTNGTSFASPYAAGVAALILSRDPNLTASAVEQVMNDNCKDRGTSGYDIFYGEGIVNARNSVVAAVPEVTVPMEETWPSTTFNSDTWVADEDAAINTDGDGEPSPPYSLNLAGSSTGGAIVQTGVINTVGLTALELSYYWQQKGNGEDPEPGDDLIVEYLDTNFEWVEIARHLGADPAGAFQQEVVTFSPEALHSGMRIRFRATGNLPGADDWFIDNIELTTGPDFVAPLPDPMQFSTPPTPSNADTMAMSAEEATDFQSPPVNYEFDCIEDSNGCDDSGWQTSRLHFDDDLLADTCYSYRVRARDSADLPNITEWSEVEVNCISAAIPGAPSAAFVTCSEAGFNLDTNGNPASTRYAINCIGASPPDNTWGTQYVGADGLPSTEAVFKTASEWNAVVASDFNPNSTYWFKVKALGQNGIETEFGPIGSSGTVSCGTIGDGDGDDDGDVDLVDVANFQICLHDTPLAIECAAYDMNGSAGVTLADFEPFTDILQGP